MKVAPVFVLRALLLGWVVATSGCVMSKSFEEAATAEYGSPVLRHAPFYRTLHESHARPDVIACVVALDPVTSVLFPRAIVALDPLLRSLQDRIETAASCERPRLDPSLESGAPQIFAGSDQALMRKLGSAATAHSFGVDYDNHDDDDPPLAQMILTVTPPLPDWRVALVDAMQAQGIDRIVFIYVGISEYPQSTKGLGKRVELGTRHAQGIPFMRHVRDPVAVVQLTGMVLDRDARIVRVGAEGIAARVPDLCGWCSVAVMVTDTNPAHVSRVTYMTDDQLQAVALMRRMELRGAPLNWQVAADELVKQLAR